MESKSEIAKEIIKEEIEKAGLEIIALKLFGSRARGDFKEYSDWDFYVVINTDIVFSKKVEIATRIRRRLLVYDITCDIIIHSSLRVDKMKNDIGYISYYAFKYGVDLICPTKQKYL